MYKYAILLKNVVKLSISNVSKITKLHRHALKNTAIILITVDTSVHRILGLICEIIICYFKFNQHLCSDFLETAMKRTIITIKQIQLVNAVKY